MPNETPPITTTPVGDEIFSVSVVDAAVKLNCTMKYVYDLVRSRRLMAKKVGRIWMISRESVVAQKRKMMGKLARRQP